MKICTTCKTPKLKEMFSICRSNKDGLDYSCKSCRKEYRNTSASKDYQKHYRKKYREDNADRMNNQSKAWKKGNMQRVRETQNKYYKGRVKVDPAYKFAHDIRKHTRRIIKGLDNSARSVELLGCSYEDAMAHIEKQFTEGMSWENHGDWHIDHIKPLASFDLSEDCERRKAAHYSNLQPLWAINNLLKGDRIL